VGTSQRQFHTNLNRGVAVSSHYWQHHQRLLFPHLLDSMTTRNVTNFMSYDACQLSFIIC